MDPALHTGIVPSGAVVEPGPEAAALRRAANRLYGIDEGCARFPAVMPQSVDDTNASQMHKAPYVAMEKTDGVHYVLLMTRVAGKPIAVMFGRSGTMFRVNLPAAAPYYKGTLLEGELVRWVQPRPRKRGRDEGTESKEEPAGHAFQHRALRFVVFEAVALRGVDLRKLPFVDRINAARFVAEPEGGADLSPAALAARAAAGCLTLAHLDMWLDAKRPRSVKDAVAIAEANTQPCDGIVFMPNVPFRQCGRRWAVLKKKFCDTLDFVLRVEKKADTKIKIAILCASHHRPPLSTHLSTPAPTGTHAARTCWTPLRPSSTPDGTSSSTSRPAPARSRSTWSRSPPTWPSKPHTNKCASLCSPSPHPCQTRRQGRSCATRTAWCATLGTWCTRAW